MPLVMQDVIADLYEAASGDNFLDSVPDAITRVAGARSCVVQQTDQNLAPSAMAYSWFSDEMSAYYVTERIFEDDVWGHYTVQQGLLDQAVNIGKVTGDKRYRHSRFYQDFIRIHGDDTGKCAGAILNRSSGGFLLYGTHRAFGAAEFEQAELDRLNQLNPHLLRGLALHERIGTDRREATQGNGIVERLDTPVVTIAPSGWATARNIAAETLLARDDGLVLRSGRLAAALPSANRRLAETIDGALHRRGGHGGSLLIERRIGRPYRLTISPLPLGGVTHAMVLIDDPDAESVNPGAQLRDLYGFTAAETEVALLIGEGHSAEEIAEFRQVSTATVKSLIHRCFRKSDTQRATQLARLVNRLPR